jgi:type II secretory pathway pseudopilin PulG
MTVALVIAAAAVLPSISFEIRRDREEELIHRGVQYSRAIRNYYKKFGRYPTRIEELESTNNLRFLRKRYKDPITGQDFKLLHFGEVKLTMSAPMAGVSNLNANGASSMNGPGSMNSPGGFGSPSGSLGAGGSFGTSGSGFGAAARPPSDSATAGQNQKPGADQSQTGDPGQKSESSSKDQLAGQTFGGGPIVGVISASKKASIREFNHKKKYSDWQFIYDPATDRGGLLSTPNQPPLQGFGNQPGQTGQQGTPNNSPFGSQPGNAPGQMNPTPTNPGPGTQQPPTDTPNLQ